MTDTAETAFAADDDPPCQVWYEPGLDLDADHVVVEGVFRLAPGFDEDETPRRVAVVVSLKTYEKTRH